MDQWKILDVKLKTRVFQFLLQEVLLVSICYSLWCLWFVGLDGQTMV